MKNGVMLKIESFGFRFEIFEIVMYEFDLIL